MIDHTLAFSRPQATAMTLSAFAADAHRFTEKVVLLTGEPEILAQENGETCLLDSLRLLVRTVANVHVYIPGSLPALRGVAEALAREIHFGNPICFVDAEPTLADYDAILNVGWQVHGQLPSTTINSNGWIARVSSKGTALAMDCSQSNPISALAAACLGVTDVFKRLIGLRPDVADVFDGLEFSLYTLDTEHPALGPALPTDLAFPMSVLAGGGAIGNGVALLIQQLNPKGDLWILDRQQYKDENLGTCVLIGPSAIGSEKAAYLAGILNVPERLRARPIPGDIEILRPQFGRDIPHPKLVLTGFDNVTARHHVQSLWPDTIFDGGISAFGVHVFSHYWGSAHQCLKCHFVEPGGAQPAHTAAHLCGLAVSRIADPDEVITEEDIELAPPEKQAWLRERTGKKVCSVVSEATLKALGAEPGQKDFSPSVPFVACMSAALMVSEAVLCLMAPGRGKVSKFTFDMLQGPQNGFHLREVAKPTCDCVKRFDTITRWRAQFNHAA